jgi:hypothetical protein
VWCPEMDLYVGGGSRRGRDICEPIGQWVKPLCGSATGG